MKIKVSIYKAALGLTVIVIAMYLCGLMLAEYVESLLV